MTLKVGDKVTAIAYTDCFGKDHPEVTGLVVDSVQHVPEAHGVAAYDRLNCYRDDLGEALARRNSTPEQVVQVEAAARFFRADTYAEGNGSRFPKRFRPTEDEHAAMISQDGWETDAEMARRMR